MFGYRVAFDAPWFLLLLLAALPLLWRFSARSLAGLGPVRRAFALAIRSCVLTLVVLALAEIQLVRTSEKLTVLYLLDQSASIPPQQRQGMIDYVDAEVQKHRRGDLGDRAGAIEFGSEADLVYPPVDDDIHVSRETDTRSDTDHTNIAAALRLAMAAFPADSARRVVIVSDGNENLGNAQEQARGMAQAGVGIDVVPVRYPPRSDVVVERITIPPAVNIGQPFDVRVVLNNTAGPPSDQAAVKGQLELTRKSGASEHLLSRQAVALEPGKRVFSSREVIDSPDFYTYEARYIPDDPAQDAVAANNRATTFTHVRGPGQVLLIEDDENRAEFDFLVDRLRKQNLQITVQPSNQLFASLAELQPFDTVILADVPREHFSAAQVKMLALNTQQMGAGLIMLGGPNSFGAGGWTGSEVEQAMPVDFQIKNIKVRPAGALALVIDRSGSMTGEKLAMAKAAAMASVDVLSPTDYVTVVAFDSAAYPIVPLTKKEDSQSINSRIDRVGAGGGTNLRPAMDLAYQQLDAATDASVRHIVLLTDGMTEGAGYAELVQQMRSERNVTVSTVAVGADADVKLLAELARVGAGRFHKALSPRSLPRIFQEEARVVARPLIFERNTPFQPLVTSPREMVKGIGNVLPPITGYVLTNKKDHPLVEVAAVSPVGPEASTGDNRTILAGWTYGLGKAVALTTDAGTRWANSWTSWPNYDKFLGQMVRWSMRPAGEQGKFSVATDLDGSQVHVAVTALDSNDEFLNFLHMSGRVVGPDMQPIELKIRQTAAGRYAGTFAAPTPGSYFLMLHPGPGMAPILAGVNMPYSAEYVDREANEGLLNALAGMSPQGTKESGVMIPDAGRGLDAQLKFDTFRHNLPKARSSQSLWPVLTLLAACLFFVDVLVRRVRVNLAGLPQLVARASGKFLERAPQGAPVETIQRLRSRKQAVSQQLATQRAAARFEPSADDEQSGVIADPSAVALQEHPGQTDATYTDRLLQAKKKLWDDRK